MTLISEIGGTVVSVFDRLVSIELDGGIVVDFYMSLFKGMEQDVFPGRHVKYQILERASGLLYEKFVLVSDPDAETVNQDLFELWDSI